MKKLLLISAVLSVTATAWGQTIIDAHELVKDRTETGNEVKLLKRQNSRVADVTTKNGAVAKRIISPVITDKTINPLKMAKSVVKAGELDDADILFESFEGWDGSDEAWVPEGWTVESKGEYEAEPHPTWKPYSQTSYYFPTPSDGKYYFGVLYTSESLDEWLISPVVTTTEGKNLHFDMNIEPLWFYNIDSDHMDFDTYEFIGEPEVVFNVKVNIREVNGEWTTLLDMAQKFKDMSGMEMLYYNLNMEMMPFTVDLSDYAGKDFQIAFQYVGADGQSYFVDNIRIGYPQLEKPLYMMPFSTQYWGFTRNFESVNLGVAVLPAFTDLMWMSYDYVPDGSYEWEYYDPADRDKVTTEEGDMLLASYPANFTDKYVTRDNLYSLPKLTVSAPGATSATYQNPAAYMQIGGKADFMANTTSGETVALNMGLVPFNRAVEEIGTYTYREDFGTPSIPIFGYNANVDKFWTDYTFHGDTEEGDGVKMTSILNFIYSSESPMVVTAADLFAYTSEIDENVEFTCGIYPVSDDFEPMIDTPIATASIKGSEINILYEGDEEPDLSCLTFDFEKAVTLDDTYQAYVVMVSGFNNPGVTYFCPFQSLYPADVPMAMGWVSKEISFEGATRTSYSAMCDAEGEPMYTSFAINLEAYLPWLYCEKEAIEITDDAPASVVLNSYYAGEDLDVTAPEWASVTVAGQYDKTVLTVAVEHSDAARSGEIVVSAPGVNKTFALSQAAGTGTAGINEITTGDNNTVEGVYNLNGQKVSSANLPAGIYLIKHTSGKVEKVTLR